tara:strand:+ start:570 stop:1340 length:771 start_codon:yes stop_codon:yes gene_type:complete
MKNIKIKDILKWVQLNELRYILSDHDSLDYLLTKPQTTLNATLENISFTLGIESSAGVIFKNHDCKTENNSYLTVLSDDPKLDFIKCISNFFKPEPCKVIKGNNVTIGKNCTIGSAGFGYMKDYDGTWIRFPHYGNIIIGDNVDIGDNNTITRGTLGDTIIGSGVKTDCGVHIAHNSVIGKDCMFAAHAMVAGSVIMGENCWVGPSTSIINKAKIGKNVFIGIGSNIIKDIPDDVVVAGNPAKIIRKNKGLQNSVK